jgi:hypothetical protein
MTELVPIPNYEGLYSVSRNGKIYSHRFDSFIPLVPKDKTYGHKMVCLYKDGHGIMYSVRSLVERAFEK